jgi:hypothetical protein
MPKNRTPKVVAGIAASFTGLVGTIIFLLETKIISFEMAILMLVALLAMHVGIGILIAVYRLWVNWNERLTGTASCSALRNRHSSTSLLFLAATVRSQFSYPYFQA